MRRLIALIVLALCALTAGAQAERPQPVHWGATLGTLRSVDHRYTVKLTADIDPGWHLYAMHQPDVEALATEVALAGNDRAELLRVNEQQPHVTFESGARTAWFASDAVFTLQVRAARPTTLHVLARYQVCNDRMCLPVATVNLPVTLPAK